MQAHDGGPCPVDPETMVHVRYRNGKVSGPIKASARRWERWRRPPFDTDWDVVAWEKARPNA